MKEIQYYDKAAHKFYQKQGFKSMPILSWDLFSKHYIKTCSHLADLTSLKKIAEEQGWDKMAPIEKELLEQNHVIVVTDLDLHIVHATNTIHEMNGYTPEEVLGQRPAIFQGEKTCKATTSKISEAIRAQQPFEAVLLNYRKDGSTYNCWIKGAPIRNKKGNVVNFIAFEREVA